MQIVGYMVSAVLLLTGAYLVFHRVVARDYQEKGRLGWLASLLQLGVFFCVFLFSLPLYAQRVGLGLVAERNLEPACGFDLSVYWNGVGLWNHVLVWAWSSVWAYSEGIGDHRTLPVFAQSTDGWRMADGDWGVFLSAIPV
jgi:hypothetical protein